MSTSTQNTNPSTASQSYGSGQTPEFKNEKTGQNNPSNQSASQSDSRELENTQPREVGREAESSQLRRSQQSNQQNTASISPRVDVYENSTGITLVADLPGVNKEALNIRIDGESLQIEGEITPNIPDNLEAFYAEVQVGRYRRSFALSRELDTAKVEASLKDGVLTLRIPKKEHAQPRKIQVQVG